MYFLQHHWVAHADAASILLLRIRGDFLFPILKGPCSYVVVSLNSGPQHRPQYTRVLNIRAPKKVPLNMYLSPKVGLWEPLWALSIYYITSWTLLGSEVIITNLFRLQAIQHKLFEQMGVIFLLYMFICGRITAGMTERDHHILNPYLVSHGSFPK